MSSTGTVSKKNWDSGNISQGVVLGVEHCYLNDGVWVRCDCGNEMLECIQADFEDSTGYEYQFRCFGGHSMSKEETWNSCFCTNYEKVQNIIEVLENHQLIWKEKYEPKSEYRFTVLNDIEEGYPRCIRICLTRKRRGRKEKFLWEIILKAETALQLAAKLKEMLRNEKEKFNGK